MILNTELEYKGDLFPSNITNYKKNVDVLHFSTANNVVLQLTVLRDSVMRFRYTTVGKFDNDFSYAIDENASRGYNHLEISNDDEKYIITTSKLICHIYKSDLRKSIFDVKDKTLICEDELGFHWEESYELGGDIVKMSKAAQNGESYYGLGDKPQHLNLKGKRFENWATDSYAFGKDTDPIYKAIPFYTGLHNGKSYGIFFDNTFKTYFDFCHERRNVTSFWAQGGEMNYYFFYGPKMQDVVTSYTDLTGTPELPPLWALGYHQCKWSYYPESNVKEVTAKFRELKIPCDAIYLDIDYMEGFRCFTWSKDYFPDPKRMVKELADDGFKTVVIIDPGIKIDNEYSVFKEGLDKDYFCKRADGPYMKGKVWPGECYFPDFTRPEVRKWWAGLFKELIEDIGVKGVWNDMNEPAVMDVPGKTFPNDVRHDYDGNPCSHQKAHNIYGMQMARATYHGLKKFNYPKRPFVITRSAYSGTQRYTSTWMGDNVASWEHLQIANVQAQRLALSGFSFAGSDIGGFAEQPNGELYARWIQLLICPINEPNAKGRRMYIPRGEWYNFWTKKMISGGKETWVDADIDSMPVFVKAGAIIPKFPVQQYVGEKVIKELALDVYYKHGKEDSELYEDADDGYDYTKGRYSLKKFNLAGNDNKMIIRIHKRGKYLTSYSTFKINLFGLPFKVKSIKVDNEFVDLKDVKFNGDNSLVVPKEFTNLQILG